MIKSNIFILFLISIFPLFLSHCNRSCPGGQLNHVPYPFGFTDGCEIKLNCTSNGTVLIGEYSVQKVNRDELLVSLPAVCGRAVQALRHLYSEHYAPTSNNAILMANCTEQVRACTIPETMLQTHLEAGNCGRDGNVSCYSSDRSRVFLDYENVTRRGCRFWISAVVTELMGDSPAVSLDVQMMKLGWWLRGRCRCSDDANCTEIVSPVDGGAGYRCRCKYGFDGDGYLASSGCRRKASSACNATKYLSGRCGGKRVGVLVGGLVAGASVIISVGVICCFIRRRIVSKSRHQANRKFYETKDITIPIYPYKLIEKATNGFAEKQRLGNGAYGTVYSAKLHDGEWVAVKRIKHRPDTNNLDRVLNEIELLSSVTHPNLVRLLGCSVENDEQILVYEFMPNGTLSQHLQRERGNGLPWPVRLTIAVETAQAIAHLHSASSTNPPIYHRDVKSSNILLDYDFKAKVADFGLSRLGIMESESGPSTHVSTAPQGTPGYLDPEYNQNFRLTDKSDVYSFGVVLVEIITSLKAVDFSRKRNEVNLACLAVDRIGRGCLDEIIDPYLVRDKDTWTLDSIRKVAEVAFRCLAFHSDTRPSMAEVAAELEQIKDSKLSVFEEDLIVSAEGNNQSSPMSVEVKKCEFRRKGLFSLKSLEGKNYSPKSVQDPWRSHSTSPSSNSLLGYTSVL